MSAPTDRTPDVAEYGAERDGQRQKLERRLFMQLVVIECTSELGVSEFQRGLAESLERRECASVIYEDLNHPGGLGILSWSEDPSDLLGRLRPALGDHAPGLRIRPDMTMVGRTYSTGFESDLDYWLLERPVETVLDDRWNWAIWYPLRRAPRFERLDPKEKGSIMREHAVIGKAYGEADLAHDVRLACHGLDTHDNDFVIGLVGRELHPLSHVVQSMRKTRQTAEYLENLGPFFVGRAVWRHANR
jgi:chlorite dismutase